MNRQRILVVDDGKVIRLVISRKLESLGYEVISVDGGKKALEVLGEGGDFDLVLLDVSMPDIGGMEVLAKIRESHDAAHLPVIMVTANDEDEDIVRAFEQGASDFVSKPINFPVMCARVKTQLKLKRVIEELERYTGDRAGEGGD